GAALAGVAGAGGRPAGAVAGDEGIRLTARGNPIAVLRHVAGTCRWAAGESGRFEDVRGAGGRGAVASFGRVAGACRLPTEIPRGLDQVGRARARVAAA